MKTKKVIYICSKCDDKKLITYIDYTSENKKVVPDEEFNKVWGTNKK